MSYVSSYLDIRKIYDYIRVGTALIVISIS